MFKSQRSVKLPSYVKKKIWLKHYPKNFPKKVKIPKKSLPDVFKEAVEKYGNDVNIIFYGREYTRKQIYEWAKRFATALHDLGVRKGDIVAIYLPNCVQFLVAYYGILIAGATVTAISPLFVPREVAYQLKDSGAETIITMDLFYENVKQVKEETQLKNVIVANIWGEGRLRVKREDLDKIINFDELLERYPPNPPKVKIKPKEDIAVLQYTGGTTGLPKGAMLTHYNILANAMQVKPVTETLNRMLGLDRTRAISVLPWYHIYGQTVEIVVGSLLNTIAVCFTQFDPAPILEAIQNFKPNTFIAVPTILILLLSHPKARDVDFSCLKYLNMGAAPTPVELARKWEELSGNPLSEGYGLTEASPVTHNRCAQIFGGELGSVGPPVPNTLAGIVDPDTNEFLPIGELGELVVSGPQVMKGYWNRPEETEKVFFKAGGRLWLKTGDLARMDEKGYFYIVDRTKDIIKYKGHSVYPREIEEVLFEHEAVMDATVIGVPDPDVGEQIKAFIVLKPEYKGKVSEDDIYYWCKEQMAAYRYPRLIEFVDSLPKSMVGKTLRRLLREREAQKAKEI